MRRRYQIAIGTALVALLLLAMWLTFHSRAARRGLSVDFTTAYGHFGEPPLVVGEQIIVAWVTNTGNCAITVDDPYVQFENTAGRLVRDQGSSWNQKGYSADLSPGSVAWLANGFDPDRKRLKFVFEYHRNGGPFLKVISKAAHVLPLTRLRPRTYDWLRRNGIVDGTVYGHYEGPWITATLTTEQASTIARNLANAEAQRLYGCQPFSDSPPARFADGYWVWHDRRGHGRADVEGTVELAPNGTTRRITVELLYNMR